MTVHLIKLAAGVRSVDELRRRQERALRGAGPDEAVAVRTRSTPKRAVELLDGGSLYWVMGGRIQCRQAILFLSEGRDGAGKSFCVVHLDREIVPTDTPERRAFQGWRYLEPDAAPRDIAGSGSGDAAEMPDEMRAELARLGVL